VDGLASAIGNTGIALPMAVAEHLTGAVICRPRKGEQFAPEVRTALSDAARNLSSALYILRYHEYARLVADIAASRIDVNVAHSRATALVKSGA
jgi:hypothetical protein